MATRRALVGLFRKAKTKSEVDFSLGSSRGFASASPIKNYPGQDDKHWIVEMEPEPPTGDQLSVNQMIDKYVKTAATVLGSAEMARNHIYACGTTTYHGFQMAASVDDAKKFEGLPGVVRVAPDHYSNVTAKDYGGDVNVDGTQKVNLPENYDKWIVVVDFADAVSEHEMVQTFHKIASKTLGSQEEAAKQITKTETKRYRGFHIHMSEDQARAVSEMPGVAQVLPDSFKPEMLAFQIPK